MQEVKIVVHDMNKGEVPPKTGYYLRVWQYKDNNGRIDTSVLSNWWDKKKQVWKGAKDTPSEFAVTRTWGNLWAEEIPMIEEDE